MKFPNFLRVAVVPYAGIFKIDRANPYRIQIVGGDEKEFLELLSRALKFSYEVIIPDVGTWGDQTNGTWTGAVGMVHQGHADIGIGKISITERRKTVVDYSHPYDIEDLSFATAIPGNLPKTEAFLMPFDSTIWSIFSIVFIVLLIAFRVIQPKGSLQWTTLQLLGYVLQQPFSITSTKASGRVLLFIFLMFVQFIPLYYSTALLSFLTIPEKEHGIRSVDDLAERIMGGTYKAVTFRGSSYVDTLKHSRQLNVKGLAERIQRNEWSIKPDKETVSNAMADGKTALIAPRNFLKSRLTNVLISDDSFYTLTRAIVLKKDFCCTDIIDMCVLRICAAGIYWKISNDAIFREKLSQRSTETSIETTQIKNLTTEDVSGAFILLLLGYCVSTFVFILEVLISKLQNYRKTVQKKAIKHIHYKTLRKKKITKIVMMNK